jgi:hypothetical protein
LLEGIERFNQPVNILTLEAFRQDMLYALWT